MRSYASSLPNGLSVVVGESRACPVVSVQLWVETGSVHEGALLGAGLSHLIEHMVFKGTRDHSGEALGTLVASLGGLWNAYTSTDRTVFHIEGPAEHWRRFVDILVQLAFYPTFPREEFEREREVIRREMAMYVDSPEDAAYKTLIQTLYKVHPRRVPIIGERTLFDRLSYEDMTAYHGERYVPNNAFFCIAGDVSAAEVFAYVQQQTSGIVPRFLPALPLAAEPRQWGPRLARREFRQPSSTLMLAWRIPEAWHEDAAAISVLCSILGDGRSAWLYKHFHDETGQAYDVSTTLLPSREGEGALVVEAEVERGERDRLRGDMLQYIAGLASLPEETFSHAISCSLRRLRTARLKQGATVQGMASLLGMSWHLSRHTSCMEEWESALQSVRAEDVRRVLLRYLSPQRLVEVSVDPLGSNGAEDSGAGEADRMSPPRVTVLSRGLTLVMRVDKRVPLVHATLALGAGCPSESASQAGINALLAETMLKGTAGRNAAQIAEALEDLGGSISASAGNNTLCVSACALAEDAAAMFDVMADVTLRPVFPKEAVETEKEALAADIEESLEDPAALAFRCVRRACYGEESYGHPPDGTVESVRGLTPTMLEAHRARIVCARNAVLSVVGDICPEEVEALVERIFAGMPSGAPVERAATPPPAPGDVRQDCDKDQSVLAVAVPGLNVSSEDLPAQMLFEEWCSDMTGPLFSEIREKRGLAYYAAVSSLVGVDRGFLCFYAGTSPERVHDVREALEKILSDMAEQGMPEDALERARATALSGRLLSLQSAKKIAMGMAVNVLFGLGADYDDRMPQLIRAVTPERMREFVRRLLDPSAPRTWVTVGRDVTSSR